MTRIFQVRSRDDVDWIRCEARVHASRLGFGAHDSTAMAIVAVELATNILKYGLAGHIELLPDGEDGAVIHAYDRGPPFRDFEAASVDGNDDRGPIDPATFARRGGLGGGLGAVRRLSDRVECIACEGGKRVSVWFRRRAARMPVDVPRSP